MKEEELPLPLRDALAILRRERDPNATLDVVQDNFAYVFVHELRKPTADEEKKTEEPKPDLGGWIRLPLAFPAAGPWGLITRQPLPNKEGKPNPDGFNPGHDNAKPVRGLGGDNYYSWTWSESPPVRKAEDILGVIRWYERRIRKGMS